MTLTRNLMIAGLALLNGCVIYAVDGGNGNDPWDWDTAEEADTDTDTDADTDTAPPVADGVVLTPNSAPAGDTALVSVTSEGDIDLTTITEVRFSSSITVLDSSARADELLLVVRVDGAATPGPVDVWIQLADGQALIVEVPFVVEPGSGDDTGCN